MIETVLQDYIHAALNLDEATFCRQVETTVFIEGFPRMEQAFQSTDTLMLRHDEGLSSTPKVARLSNKATVHELRPRDKRPLGDVSIGRSEDCDLVIEDETVSSSHAIYRPAPKTGEPSIMDQESTNGTFVNGHRMLPFKFFLIQDGDVISFGDVAFKFFTPTGLYHELRKTFC